VNASLAVAALLPMLVSVSVLALVVLLAWWMDRYEREPIRLVGAMWLWGALAAPMLAVGLETAIAGLHSGNLGPFLTGVAGAVWTGPFVEEGAKALGLLVLVALTRQMDGPTDGMVYGAAVGLGFAATENLLYGVVATGRGAAPGDVAAMMLIRTVLSAGVHALATCTFGGFLGAAQVSRGWGRRFLWIVSGLALAGVLHGAWNLALTSFSVLGPEPASLGVVVIAVIVLEGCLVVAFAVALLAEHRILLRELREEVELGVLPEWVAEIVPHYRRRIRTGWWPSREERAVLTRLLTRLAFTKHALRRVPGDEAGVAGLEVVHLRHRLRSILGPPEGGEAE